MAAAVIDLGIVHIGFGADKMGSIVMNAAATGTFALKPFRFLGSTNSESLHPTTQIFC